MNIFRNVGKSGMSHEFYPGEKSSSTINLIIVLPCPGSCLQCITIQKINSTLLNLYCGEQETQKYHAVLKPGDIQLAPIVICFLEQR